MNYRSLTSSEIKALQDQGCSAKDWADIQVADPFVLSQVSNVRFTGKVYLGANVTLDKKDRLFLSSLEETKDDE